MNAEEWRLKTLQQLAKDIQLAGGSMNPDFLMRDSLESAIKTLTSIVRGVKSNKQEWDNLNYRIDLPPQLDLNALSDEEVVRLYLLRSFQKVWLREQFSNEASKDGGDTMQKHLKP